MQFPRDTEPVVRDALYENRDGAATATAESEQPHLEPLEVLEDVGEKSSVVSEPTIAANPAAGDDVTVSQPVGGSEAPSEPNATRRSRRYRPGKAVTAK